MSVNEITVKQIELLESLESITTIKNNGILIRSFKNLQQMKFAIDKLKVLINGKGGEQLSKQSLIDQINDDLSTLDDCDIEFVLKEHIQLMEDFSWLMESVWGSDSVSDFRAKQAQIDSKINQKSSNNSRIADL